MLSLPSVLSSSVLFGGCPLIDCLLLRKAKTFSLLFFLSSGSPFIFCLSVSLFQSFQWIPFWLHLSLSYSTVSFAHPQTSTSLLFSFGKHRRLTALYFFLSSSLLGLHGYSAALSALLPQFCARGAHHAEVQAVCVFQRTVRHVSALWAPQALLEHDCTRMDFSLA